MALKLPQRRNVAPGVLEAQNASETLERELIFGMAKFYHFYRDMREMVCVYDPETISYRQDFSIPRYNIMFKALDQFYRRFDNRSDLPQTFGIPTVQLSAYIIDWANRSSVPEDMADQLLTEITQETEYSASLTLDQLQDMAKSEPSKPG